MIMVHSTGWENAQLSQMFYFTDNFSWLQRFSSLLILTSRTSFAHENPAYRLMPRFNYCGPLGCVVDEDREALRCLSELGAGVIEKYPRLDYKHAPKLLIVDGVAPGAIENWLTLVE
jgi:hypothetical protein